MLRAAPHAFFKRNMAGYTPIPGHDNTDEGLPLPVTASHHRSSAAHSAAASTSWSNGWPSTEVNDAAGAAYPPRPSTSASLVSKKGKNTRLAAGRIGARRTRARDLERQAEDDHDDGDDDADVNQNARGRGDGGPDQHEAATPIGMSFSIRFTDGSPDLVDMYVSAHESVREVKNRVSRNGQDYRDLCERIHYSTPTLTQLYRFA